MSLAAFAAREKKFRNRTRDKPGITSGTRQGGSLITLVSGTIITGTFIWIARGQETIEDLDKGVESVSDPGIHRFHVAFYFI